uniref:Uncharacterized protein n=1 Tax=Tanacetum cinerariifolium TaxID=118510 RepID=A0A6L2KYJ6_TANCI|nr:hypothetical protein [Tanacetum cinerariifolium]
MSAPVAGAQGGDDGGEPPPPSRQIGHGMRGQKATKGGDRDGGRKGCAKKPGTSRSRKQWMNMAKSSRCTTPPRALLRSPRERTLWDGSWLGTQSSAGRASRLLYVLQDQQEEIIWLRDLGADTPTDVPYTKEKILSMVRKGKQRGHIPEIGRVVAGKGKTVIFVDQPQVTSNDRICKMLRQLDSQIEISRGSRSRSDGGRDDQSGENEDAGGDDDI